MRNSAVAGRHDQRSFSRWFARLLIFFVIAMTGLAAVAANAEDEGRGGSEVDETVQLDALPKTYRERALTALLANERRSIDQRIGQIMRQLEVLAADEAKAEDNDVILALSRLQQELDALEQRHAEVMAELAEIEQNASGVDSAQTEEVDSVQKEEVDSVQTEAEASEQPVFIPASKPRDAETAASTDEVTFPPELRLKIQEALVFLGGYDSTIDGAFGARTETAIRRFQTEIGAEPTGRLTEEQKDILLDRAAAFRQDNGLRSMIDDDIGFRLVYPGALLTEDDQPGDGYRLLSDADGEAQLQVVEVDSRDLRALFDDLISRAGDGYQHFAGSWFVASGEVEGEMFYSMGHSADDRSVVAHLTYPAVDRERWDPFSVILYNSFALLKTG